MIWMFFCCCCCANCFSCTHSNIYTCMRVHKIDRGRDRPTYGKNMATNKRLENSIFQLQHASTRWTFVSRKHTHTQSQHNFLLFSEQKRKQNFNWKRFMIKKIFTYWIEFNVPKMCTWKMMKYKKKGKQHTPSSTHTPYIVSCFGSFTSFLMLNSIKYHNIVFSANKRSVPISDRLWMWLCKLPSCIGR